MMEKYTEFLDDTEATARTLADNYIACKKKRDMYEHWFCLLYTSAVPLENRLRYLKRHLGEEIVINDNRISYDEAITQVIQLSLIHI